MPVLTLLMLSLLLTACTPLASGDDVLRDAATPQEAGDEPLDAGASANEDAAADSAVSSADSGELPCPPTEMRETRHFDHAELSADTHFSCQYEYEIEGHLLVSKGTLSIEPGVRVLMGPAAFLLVGTGARLTAVGKPDQPIVFTAAQHPARPGAFRGIFMLGLADTALPNNATLGLAAGDLRAAYGGDDDQHDCGELRHVRIEFAGGASNDEDFPAAALTLAGCGRKTRIDSVQVHASTDGIGLIGGMVPLKRVLVSAPSADGIEWAAGYRGLIQFAVVQTFHGAGAALKGARSLADQSTPPGSAPVISNATLVGAHGQGLASGPADPNGFETGVLLQAGTRVTLQNSLIFGFAGSWLDVRGEATAQQFATASRVTSTIFADAVARTTPGLPSGGIEPADGEDDDGNFSEDAELRKASLDNRFFQDVFTLRAPFARPPERPDFSADGFVDGGKLSDSAPAGWADLWEAAFYAGALPRVQFAADRALDWTVGAADRADATWLSFPRD